MFSNDSSDFYSFLGQLQADGKVGHETEGVRGDCAGVLLSQQRTSSTFSSSIRASSTSISSTSVSSTSIGASSTSLDTSCAIDLASILAVEKAFVFVFVFQGGRSWQASVKQ